MAGLIDILSGGAPTAADETTGAIAGSLASDPSRLAYSSGPVGQALGQISGGVYQAQARDAAQRIADAHAAAMPSLLGAYASDNPWQAIANDPNAPPYAKWMIGSQTPLQVGQTKNQLANAGLTRAEIPGVEAVSKLKQAGAAEYGAGGPGAGGAAPPTGGLGGGVAPVAAPQQLSPEAQAALAMPPGPEKLAALKALPPAMQTLIRGRARRPAGVTAPGGAPAAAPAAATPPASVPAPSGGNPAFGGVSI
jgi:hypothetical protein